MILVKEHNIKFQFYFISNFLNRRENNSLINLFLSLLITSSKGSKSFADKLIDNTFPSCATLNLTNFGNNYGTKCLCLFHLSTYALTRRGNAGL
jgi:hypothetical protein